MSSVSSKNLNKIKICYSHFLCNKISKNDLIQSILDILYFSEYDGTPDSKDKYKIMYLKGLKILDIIGKHKKYKKLLEEIAISHEFKDIRMESLRLYIKYYPNDYEALAKFSFMDLKGKVFFDNQDIEILVSNKYLLKFLIQYIKNLDKSLIFDSKMQGFHVYNVPILFPITKIQPLLHTYTYLNHKSLDMLENILILRNLHIFQRKSIIRKGFNCIIIPDDLDYSDNININRISVRKNHFYLGLRLLRKILNVNEKDIIIDFLDNVNVPLRLVDNSSGYRVYLLNEVKNIKHFQTSLV